MCDFIRIKEIRDRLKANTPSLGNQPVIFSGVFGHEILELKDKCSNFAWNNIW